MKDMIDFLAIRAKQAQKEKESAYDAYSQLAVGSENKWKHKVVWQNACQRLRNLRNAIDTIKSEYGVD